MNGYNIGSEVARLRGEHIIGLVGNDFRFQLPAGVATGDQTVAFHKFIMDHAHIPPRSTPYPQQYQCIRNLWEKQNMTPLQIATKQHADLCASRERCEADRTSALRDAESLAVRTISINADILAATKNIEVYQARETAAKYEAMIAELRAAGYRVSHSRTADAITASTSVGVHSGQSKPSPTRLPRAEYVPGVGQRNANVTVQRGLPSGAVYEWRPVGNSTSLMGVGNSAGPDWAVRSNTRDTFPATLIHIPSGHETHGFPDYASLGRYIRGRNKNLTTSPGNHRLWCDVFRADFHPDS